MVLFQAMSSFPPKEWRVRYLKDMQHLACEAIEEDEISMAAYLAVRPSEGEEGSYRFALWGPDKIKLKFPVSKLLPSDLFEDMYIEAELAIGDQIKMERNSVCSAWVDIVELVRSQDVLVVDSNDDDISPGKVESRLSAVRLADFPSLPHLLSVYLRIYYPLNGAFSRRLSTPINILYRHGNPTL